MKRGSAHRVRTCLAAVMAAFAVFGVLPALSSANLLEKFKNCPKENPEINTENAGCVYSQSQYKTSTWAKPEPPSGLQAGNITIPFTKALILQGGIRELSVEPVPLVAPEDGALRVVPVGEPVPGGLRATIDTTKLHGPALEAYKAALANREDKVTATIEVAPVNAEMQLNAGNVLNVEGTFLTLPVKMKFTNSFLGESCYAGSDASPILVDLTDATTSPPPPNEPISGQLGTLSFLQGTVIAIKEDSLVGNSFEAPAVEGCGREAAWQEEVDAAINSKAGLPSPAGHNSTRINGTQFLTGVTVLKEHGF